MLCQAHGRKGVDFGPADLQEKSKTTKKENHPPALPACHRVTYKGTTASLGAGLPSPEPLNKTSVLPGNSLILFLKPSPDF